MEAISDNDVTLALLRPDGVFRCSDRPVIEGSFPAGEYHVWVAAHTEGTGDPYELVVSQH